MAGRCKSSAREVMLALPWQLILNQAPALLLAAGDLLRKSRPSPADIATATDLNALRDRCAELAKDQQAYAELVKQLIDQLNAVTEVAQATATRVRHCMIIGVAGVALGVVACAIALFR
jgi:hypothetical protein